MEAEPSGPDTTGCPPGAAQVPDGMRLYAVGDVHGRADLLARLLERIAEDAATCNDGWTQRLILLGDYVDRGPDSRGVLDLLTGPPPVPGIQRVFLKGNHEDMMLRALAESGEAGMWLLNGGDATLRSYGVAPARDGVSALAEVLPAAHRRFLEGLALCHACGGYLFVHAGLKPGVPLDRQDPQSLLWIRRAFLSSSESFGAVVVHGHSVRSSPEERPNRIGIDTGAYASGILTCLVLEGAGRRYLQTG